MTGTRLSAVIQGMVAGRHGSHGRPTDSATTPALVTIAPTTSAVNGLQLTVDDAAQFLRSSPGHRVAELRRQAAPRPL